jgi:crooked neck
MEMRYKFVNHARNVWERACATLPRMDQFWFKYAYMEEILTNYDYARLVFKKYSNFIQLFIVCERWMTWVPPKNAWYAYLKFEERMGEIDNCRIVLNDFIEAYPEVE